MSLYNQLLEKAVSRTNHREILAEYLHDEVADSADSILDAETLCGMNSTIILDRDTAMRPGETEEEEADNSHVQV